MEELNLNKKNGEILSSGEWNRIISALNALINYYNNFPDKISAFDNDTGYLTNSNIEGLASEQYVRDAIQALVDSGVMAGPKGEDGISPTVTVLEIEGGHSVTISDASNSYTFNILNGEEGLPGVDGTTPHIDPTSKHWIIGTTDTGVIAEGQNGSDGLLGQNGADGADGKSAYEVAVENGYEGTVEQWITSLHGQDGNDGSNGLNGKSAYELAVDNGYSGTLELWLLSLKGTNGTNGLDGQNGTNGTNGTDGITPTVTITPITGGNTIFFNYGTNDPRNTSFNVMNGTASSLSLILANWNESDSSSAAYIQNKPSLFSGNYNDLSNKPTIPNEVTEQTVSEWGFTKNTGTSTFSGSYTDLTDKPTIPTVPSNETAVSGGNTLSVVTTGEKYNWNNKASIWSGTLALYDNLSSYDSNTIYIITAS